MNITLKNLSKHFPSRTDKSKAVIAVDRFNLEIPDGLLVGLLGPSGCGKSTTLNLISGLEDPTEGQIFFGDRDVTKIPPEDRGIGLVFQNYALYPHLTVEENLLFPLQNLKGKSRPSKEEMRRRALETAKLVQIDQLMERKPGELSGGQQQRVAIARALIKMPNVLLLDEPLSNLDARLRLQTREELRRIQRETGITTVFVTHDQEEAMAICDLMIVMKEGVIQQVGKPQDIYDHPANLFVAQFLGNPAINVLEGEIRGEKLYIGEEAVLPAEGQGDRNVWVAIRPEGFLPEENGPFTCDALRVEVMGRDVSVVSTHKSMTGASLRAIVPAESAVDITGGTVRFALKPRKVHLFDHGSGEKL